MEKKSASRGENPESREAGTGGRRGGEEPVEPHPGWQGKESGRKWAWKWREREEGEEWERRDFWGQGRGVGAGHVGRGTALSGPEFSRRPRDLVAGEAPGGWGHLRSLRIFSVLAPLFILLERGSLFSHFRCRVVGGYPSHPVIRNTDYFSIRFQ